MDNNEKRMLDETGAEAENTQAAEIAEPAERAESAEQAQAAEPAEPAARIEAEFDADSDAEYGEDESEYEDEDDAPARRHGCSWAGLIIALLFGALLLGGAAMLMSAMDEIAGDGSLTGQEVTVEIPQGTRTSEIAQLLQDQGVIEHALFFKGYLAITDKAGDLQYGTFQLRVGAGYDELIEVLTQPQSNTVRVTFPEGSTIFQFARRVEEAGLCTADEFIEAANNVEAYADIPFWSRIEADPNTFMLGEGYLFPETYEFYKDDTPENIVRKLYEQFNDEITADMYARMDELGMSLREIITLASLIQEEAGDPANQADVSSVFHNRLQPDSPYPRMGSDVTWYYLEDFVLPYYAKQAGVSDEEGESVTPTEIKYAYFTGDSDPNSRVGLPAGPLSSPGRDAIHAALYPSDTDYYFFLTDKNGKYYYANTYEQHQQNIVEMERVNNS